ncbi:Ig-like domain-containing protein [Erythrobacter sp. F6033]|uniref:Ig-like domain-containing protein n=1 Tax=Erythrobacter sp. F6033 TaxID=2926401 RepID=UPI001FF58C07|nr:Ig-like domain-containing protein [Erythrobacter sp. F6033]MCK0129260.1 Ig-like domain-containing protein [Erythrobacter sp. F6033]
MLEKKPLKIHLIPLEPRMMFDGAAVVTAASADLAQSAPLQETFSFEHSAISPLALGAFDVSRSVVVGSNPDASDNSSADAELVHAAQRDDGQSDDGEGDDGVAADAANSDEPPVQGFPGVSKEQVLADGLGLGLPGERSSIGIIEDFSVLFGGNAAVSGLSRAEGQEVSAIALDPLAFAPSGEQHQSADVYQYDRVPIDLTGDNLAPPIGDSSGANDFIFIDTSVENYQELVETWEGRGTIVLIDGNSDGVDQVLSALAGESDIGAIHIVSHGENGMFWLGDTRIDSASLTGELSSAFASIGSKLGEGGDILLYGCDTGAGEDGQRLLDNLALITGADIAASIDDTGSIARGGDWTLENRLGVIETASLVAREWEGLLAPVALVATGHDSFNENGVQVADNTRLTAAGSSAVWSNVATVNGQSISVRATITAISAGESVEFRTSGDDFGVFLRKNGSGGTGTAEIRWDIFFTATGAPANIDINFTVADIDGNGGPETREYLVIDTDTLSSFQAANGSRVLFDTSVPGEVTASGSANENSGVPSAARFNWLDTNSFTIEYNLAPGFTGAFFGHDGDADFNLGTGGTTVSIPRLDLDNNNSTANGSGYMGTFVENGSAVSIVDNDVRITNPDGSVEGVTVTLTNPETGDSLLVNGSDAAIGSLNGGITYTRTATEIILTGAANAAQYQNALKAITFTSAGERPSETDRTINISFQNAALNSNVATSTIKVVEVNDPPTAVNDPQQTIDEDTSITNLDVLGNDSDGDGDTLSVISANASNGTVTINADGTLDYTPNAEFSGTDTITYTISDGRGGTSTATVPIVIDAVNDNPTTNGNLPPQAHVDAQQGIFVNAASGFSDVEDPNGLTFTATGLPPGLSIDPSTGFITGTIDNSASQGGSGGVYNVSVTATDTGGLTATQNFSWTVTNPAPQANNDGGSTLEDTPITFDVLANDQDPDGDDIRVVSATAPNGSVVINADGTITYTPNADYSGPEVITYTISDGEGGTSTATVNLFVTEQNDPPVAVDDTASTDGTTPVNVNVLANDSDPDGGTLSVTSATSPDGTVTINPDGSINFVANDGFTGPATVTYTISDGQGGTDTATLTINVAEVIIPPFVDLNGPESEGTAVGWEHNNPANTTNAGRFDNGTVASGEPEIVGPGISASYSNTRVVVSGADEATFEAAKAADDYFEYRFTTAGDISPDTVISGLYNADWDASGTYKIAVEISTDNFATSTVLTRDFEATQAGGPVYDPTVNDIADDFTLQPGTNYQVRVYIYDASGAPPIFDDFQIFTIERDTSFEDTFTENGPPISIADTDAFVSDTDDVNMESGRITLTNAMPGDELLVNGSNAATGTLPGGITYTNNGTEITLTGSASEADYAAAIQAIEFNNTSDTPDTTPRTIEVTVNDGQSDSNTAISTINVVPVDDAPVAGALPPQTNVDADSGVSVDVSGAFSDPEGGALTFSATGLPTGLTINAMTGEITGTIDNSASQGGTGGVYNVVVTASDPGGLSVDQDFTWTVTNPAPVAADDTASTDEDTPIIIDVLPNDSDPDGDVITLISAFASVGQATLVGNQISYTPPANFSGTATISYRISDGEGGTSEATVTVTVNPVNDDPDSVQIPPVDAVDSETVSVPVAGAFSDVDGDTLTFSATDLPPGLTIDPDTGVISGTITPDASQTGGGVYTATITVDDGNGGTTTETITFNVANPAPEAVNDNASTDEDVAVTIDVLGNDSDPDGDPLTVTSADAQNGTTAINADGTVTYTPNPGFNGTDTITYEISDGNGGTSIATVTVVVNDINDIPVTSGSIGDQTNLDAQDINLPVAGGFADPDGDALSFTANGLPAGLTIDPDTGVITGTIDNSASQVNGGSYSITVTADDGRGGTVSQTFNWDVSNPAPVASNDTATTDEDTPVNIPVLANDVDPDGDDLTAIEAKAGNGTVTINADGTLVYTPNPDFNGTDTIVYTIDDGEGGVSSASVDVTVTPVNDGPTTVGLPNQNGEDSQVVSIPTASAFNDVDGDVLTFSAEGLPPALSIDPDTGVISGTLASDSSQNGPFVVTVTATDPSGEEVSTTFVYSVQNIPPIAQNDAATTPEDTPVTVAVLANDSDPDGDPLTITSASADNGSVVVNADGTVTFTPNDDFNGDATVTYTVSDGQGGIATATLVVTVTAENDAPVAVDIPDVTNEDNQSVSIATESFFSDIDGDDLTITAAGLPPGLSIDPATGIISGTLDIDASQGSPYTVTLTADDGNGGTVSQDFVWTVTNPAPTAVNDNASVDEDSSVNVDVLGNDNDPDGDPLTVTSASAPNGTVVIEADGTLTYTPNPDFNGEDTVTYTIDDGNGGVSTAAVIVTVNPINDDPVAVDDAVTTDEDTPVTIGVLGNDSDVDGNDLTVTTAASPDGTVTINPDGTLEFTPNPNFNGTTTISYEISDGNGGTDTATVTVTVNPINDPPVANPDAATTDEDTPVNVPLIANDTDADGDALTVTAATAANGTVVINPDGSVDYTPNPDFNGTDTITYTISDGNGGFSTSTATITVNPVNDDPVAAPIAPQTNDDSTPVTLDVSGNFSDVDGDDLTFSATGLPPGLSIDADGNVTGTLDPDASQGGPAGDGVYSVTVTADDGNGGTVDTTFIWTVNNPPPEAVDDTAATDEDTPVNIPVLANDSDPDGDPLTVTAADAGNGTVVIEADGTVTYTPNPNFNGTDTITYTISDGNGGTSTATVTITVDPVNDDPVATPIAPQDNIDSANVSLPTAGNFSDLDGDTLTFSASGLPAGLSIDPATGEITGTIAVDASQGGTGGVYNVTVTADDGNGGTVSTTFAWTVTNPPPVAVDDSAATDEDTRVNIPVLANDSDPDGDPLTVTSATAPNGTVVIEADGTVTYTPNADFNGTDTITYTISDGNGGTSTATVTVTVDPVNDDPVVGTPLPNLANVDSAAVNVPVAGNFSDLDGDTLTFSASGLPAGLSIDANGNISGTIDPSASQGGPAGDGIYTVSVTADDGNGGTVTTSFAWTVTNPPPVAADDAASTNEDTPVNIPVLANDSDPDGDPLTVTSATAPNGSVVIEADGTVTYTPNPDFNGTDTITYQISDGEGGTSTASVTVTVNPVNDDPVADPQLTNQTDQDADVISLDVSGNFDDVDGDALTFTATGLPAGLSIDANGLITGTLDPSASQGGPNSNGLYTVTITADDGNGGTVTSTFVWTVGNPGPSAAPDTASTNEDAPVTVNVLTNDSDPDGDTLTVIAADAANGSVLINADGTVTYTPDPNFNGTDTVIYTVSDGEGGTATSTVTIAVNPLNDAPETVGLPDLTDGNNEVINVPLASAFSDAENDALTFSAVGLPAGLSIDPATGEVTGTTDATASTGGPLGDGVYTVTVTVSDGNGGTVDTTFTWTINNQPPTAVNDSYTGTEDTPQVLDVLTNDIDPDGNATTPIVIIDAQATNGTAVVNPDGTITFTPDQDFNGTATVTYTIEDANGDPATAIATIVIAPENDAPDAATLPNRDDADGDAITIDAGALFSDPEGDTLSFSATNLPAGLSIDPVTGQVTGTIDADASQVNGGVYQTTITADDGNGGTTDVTFVWTVTNPGPTATDDTASTTEDTPIPAIDVLGNDVDPDGDDLTVVSASAPNGTVVINPDGTLEYTPDANFNGTDTITYQVDDGQGGTSTAIVTVTVGAENDVPTAPALPAIGNDDADVIALDLSPGFADSDGDLLTFTATGLPTGLSIDAAGNVTGTIDPAASQGGPNGDGIYQVTVTADDGNGGMVDTTFTWTISNPAPLAVNDNATTDEDTPVNIPVLANDSDPDGDPLTVTQASAGNGTVVIEADGTVTYTPDADFNGTDTITYEISDGNGGTSTATVTVTVGPVNDDPVVTPLPSRDNVDSAAVSVPTSGNFSDVDGDTLAFDATGLPAGLTIDPSTGVISGTIDPAASQGGVLGDGVYSVTVTADDGNGGTVSTTFAWTVTNPPPVAVDDTASTTEDTSINIDVLANDSDPDGDTISVVSASAANGTVTILPDGTIDYTPDANFNGTDTITYQISDGNGGTATATVTVTVDPANDPPVAVDDSATTDEDAPVTIPLLGNDSDVDGDTLTVTDATAPNGSVTINADGTVTYTPDPDFNGTDTITYTIDDGNGGTDTATITVIIAPVNDPPVATPDTATTDEDTPVTIPVLGNDIDVDGDPLTVTDATSPDGTVTINPDGTITFAPNPDFNGPTTITYTIDDGMGGTATTTVTVNVAPVNDPPVAVNDNATTPEDTPVTVPILANDSDADGDALTVTDATAPNGTVVINPDGTVTYTPDPNFNGTDVITYTVSDGMGGTDTATLTITVDPVNDVPVAIDDSAAGTEDQPLTIPVLANDSDPDGDPLTITEATSPNGTVTINPDGTITFVPDPNFNGPTTITYTIDDGNGGTATATVDVTIAAVNDPPVGEPDPATTDEDTPITIPVLANDNDVDGDPLTVVSANAPNGMVTINPDGTITYTPNPDFNGTDTITYQISDGMGGFDTVTSTVTVNPVNDPPVAVDDITSVLEDSQVTIPVLVNDTDADGDPLTVTDASANSGTVTINPDGTITYVPNPDFFGTDTITYTISDGNGGTSTATVTVEVINTNEAPVDEPEAVQVIGGTDTIINVLDNASDPDGDPLEVIFASVDAGTVIINPDGTLTYSAPPGFFGEATIRYIISDGEGGFVESFVTITVVEASADLNFLLGDEPAPGIPDAYLVDRVLDQTDSFISTPLIILDTVNDFRSLGGTGSLNVDMPLLNAVNNLRSLNGIGGFDPSGHPIDDVVAHIDHIRDLRFGVDRLFDPRFGDFQVESLTGFSVRQLDTGNDQVMIESIVRDRVVYVEMRDIGSDEAPRIIEYQLLTRDGTPLPDWIRMDARGLAIIERPVDADTLRLIVRALREDGEVIEIPVVIQGATGEIQLDEAATETAMKAEKLETMMAQASAEADDEASKLLAAFS